MKIPINIAATALNPLSGFPLNIKNRFSNE